MTMLRTAEIDMTTSVAPSDIATFLTNAAWAICSTYHTVLKAYPSMAIFGRDELFNIPYIAGWNKIGDYRQRQADLNTKLENNSRIDYDYKVGGKYLYGKMVSSTKQKAGMTVNHGQSRQFIQMAQSGLNMEANWKIKYQKSYTVF
jgi:hypothetical protein